MPTDFDDSQTSSTRSVSDPMAEHKQRARWRLIGALAFSLASAALAMVVLRDTPRPLSQDFILQMPPKPTAVAVAPVAPVAPAPKAEPKQEPKPESKSEPKAEPKAEPKEEHKGFWAKPPENASEPSEKHQLFADGLIQATQVCKSLAGLKSLWKSNQTALDDLEKGAPDLFKKVKDTFATIRLNMEQANGKQ